MILDCVTMKIMVSLESIAKQTKLETPDIHTVFMHLDQLSQPVAKEKNPLRIIAPAIYKIHDRTKALIQSLEKDRPPRTQAITFGNAFDDLTGWYVTLKGIEPPSRDSDRKKYNDEINYARKLIEIAYNLLIKIGGKGTPHFEPVQLPKSDRIAFKESLKSLEKENPVPHFATEAVLKSRSAKASWVSWIFLIFWIFWYFGFWKIFVAIFNP